MAMTDGPEAETDEKATRSEKRTVWAVHIKWHGKEWVIGMDRSGRVPLENAMLPKGGSRWRFFGAGAIVQSVFVVLMLMIPLLFPDRVLQLRRFVATVIAPTSSVVSAEQPLRPRRPRRPRVMASRPLDVPADRLQIPSPVESVPISRTAKALLAPAAPRVAVEPPTLSAINTSTIPDLQKPREPVRLGGFGDPSGLSETKTASSPNVVQLGSFNPPSGLASGTSRSRPRTVREGIFGNEGAITNAQTVNRAVEVSSRSKPVQILFKPTPEYTKVALAKKIQGDVLLEVLFSAGGEVRVLRVLKGLGYGLDQTAIEAAHEIRFRPAQNEAGEAIDSIARVRIAFELAY